MTTGRINQILISKQIPYTPYPLGLQFGSFGIGVGLSVNLPAFEPKSMIRAALAVLTNRPEPWKYLEANYGLTIPDED